MRKTHFTRPVGLALGLETLSKIHEALINLSRLCQGRALGLCVPCPLAARKIDNCKLASAPRVVPPPQGSLLDFEAKEAVAPAGDTVASCASHSPFLQTSLQDQDGFSDVGTDDFPKAGNHFTIRRMLGGFE